MDNTPIATRGSIGAILVDSGRLSVSDAERVLRAQKELGLRFGEAALQLGLITEADLQKVLSAQYEYPYLQRGDESVAPELVAAYEPFGSAVESLRALRSQLILRWFRSEPEHQALVIAGAGRGEGRSYLAANLAIVFSQLGERTLLIDADMRQSRQHELFRIENRAGLSSLLSGRNEAGAIRRVPAFKNLSVIPAGPLPPNPQELLERHAMVQVLERSASEFDVILIDTPASGISADAEIVASMVKGALLIARRNATSVPELTNLIQRLSDSGAKAVGSVFNNYTGV